jgi:TonB family protein
MFFFEKKNQKTFASSVRAAGTPLRPAPGWAALWQPTKPRHARRARASWTILPLLCAIAGCTSPAPPTPPNFVPIPINDFHPEIFQGRQSCDRDNDIKPDQYEKQLTKIYPIYPSPMAGYEREGKAMVNCTIGVDGVVSNCAIGGWVNSKLFADSLLQWAQSLRFQPAMYQGHPIARNHCFFTDFHMDKSNPDPPSIVLEPIKRGSP